jgi:hypothetical protein
VLRLQHILLRLSSLPIGTHSHFGRFILACIFCAPLCSDCLDVVSSPASSPPYSRHGSLSALFSSQIAASSTCTSALCCGSNTFSFVCHLSQSEHIPISAGSSSPAFSVPHFVRIVSTSHLLTKTFLCLSSRFQTHAPVSANRDVHLAPLTLNCVLSDIFASRLTL